MSSVSMMSPYDNDACAWVSNVLAIKHARSIPILDRLMQEEARDMAERIAIAHASGVLESHLMGCRSTVADICASWFDGSAFYGSGSCG